MKQENLLKFFIVLLFSSIVLFVGCEQKTDDTDQPADTIQTDTSAVDTTASDTTAADTTVTSLEGTWRGTLNQRASTFNIRSFEGNKISGTITIQSRGTITKEVGGTYVPETRAVRLSDQTRSRDMGTYSGTISGDGTTLSGTFTGNDGSTSNFSFKKEK